MNLSHLLVNIELAKSIAEAKRLIKQGAVEIDGVKINRDGIIAFISKEKSKP